MNAEERYLVRELVQEHGPEVRQGFQPRLWKILLGRAGLREVSDQSYVTVEPLTLAQLANGYGLSRERIRQLEREALGRLRSQIRRLGLDVDLDEPRRQILFRPDRGRQQPLPLEERPRPLYGVFSGSGIYHYLWTWTWGKYSKLTLCGKWTRTKQGLGAGRVVDKHPKGSRECKLCGRIAEELREFGAANRMLAYAR